MGKERALLLRVLRASHEPRLTQTKLARRAGLSAARYWQIENGEGAAPSDDEKTAVARVLNVPPSAIQWPWIEQEANAS